MTTEQQNSIAFDVASGFDVNAPHSEEDWMRLDWAMTVSGVAEEFPELLEALEKHFSITLSYNDLGNFVCSAIHAALRSVRKASINELDEFTNYYREFIPEQVLNPIEDCVSTLIQDYLDALKSFLEEEDLHINPLGGDTPFGFRVCCVSHGNNPILCCEVRDSLLIVNHLKQDIMKYLVIADIGLYDVIEYYLFGIFNTRQEAEDYIKNNPDPFNLGEFTLDDPHFRFDGDLEWHYEHSIKEFDGTSPAYIGHGFRYD